MQVGKSSGEKKNAKKTKCLEFDVDSAIDHLGPVPDGVPQLYKNQYSWAYHRHESLFKGSIPNAALKEQCRIVGQKVAAKFVADS